MKPQESQKTVYLSLHTVLPAGSPSKHLPCPLQQVTQVQGELRWLRQALQFPCGVCLPHRL